MHIVVSRAALSLAVAALVAGALATAHPAGADTVPQRPAHPDAVSAGGFTALTPARLLDTRPSSALTPSGTRTLTVTGRGGVPATGVAAVVLNLTAVAPQSSGYLSVYPGPSRPTVSNVNYTAGRTVANLAVVPVASDGTVQLFNGSSGTTNVLADVTGWFAPASGTPSAEGAFKPAGPTRLLDTRGSTPIPAQGVRRVQVTGQAGVPAVAGAAVLNVTAVTSAAAGYLTVYPGGTRPTSSNLNFTSGQTVAGLAAAQLGSDGSVTIFNSSSRPLQVTVDLAGWFRGTTARQASNFSFLAPARVFDTRGSHTPLASQQARAFPVTGRGGVPTSGVAAVVLTVTVTATQGSGYLTVYPGGNRPTASTLNFAKGQTVPNLVVVPVQGNGTITVFNGSGGPADVLADVAGFVRSNDLTVPAASVSHYIRRSVTPTQTDAQITAATSAIGRADAAAASTTDRQVVLLQFGAQSAVAGPAGNQKGVRLSTSPDIVRLTYPQVVAAVNGYVDGYVAGRGGATNPVTVLIGTNTDGFAGADTSYPPTVKGQDWANLVVEPAVAHAGGTGITVTGASDIEPDFDANVSQITAWIKAYLAAGPNPLVNNGAASGCPTTLGQISQTCSPVQIQNAAPGQYNTWRQADHYAFAGGIDPTRITVLPQVYVPVQAVQWENISLTGAAARRPTLNLAGVLTSVAACNSAGGCSSLDPADAWTLMTQVLESSTATDQRTVPAVSDIAID